MRSPPAHRVHHAEWRGGELCSGSRGIPEETPIAITYDGTSYAVMMATPSDIEDFALGFSLTENVIDSPDDIDTLDVIDVEGGIEARMWLKPEIAKRHLGKRRSILGPTGCGLCGVDSIAQALKPAAKVVSGLKVTPRAIMDAIEEMQQSQALHLETHAVHAAALWHPGGLIVREDVGRHNALDKLIGAAVSVRVQTHDAVVLLTSRISVELVQKTAVLGTPVIAAASAPTALAVRTAEAAGITLVAAVRDNGFQIFTHAERIRDGARAHVA